MRVIAAFAGIGIVFISGIGNKVNWFGVVAGIALILISITVQLVDIAVALEKIAEKMPEK